MTGRRKLLLLVVLVLVPGLLSLVTAMLSFSNAKTVDFCSSCHVMGPWHEDMMNPESESLASMHFQRRWIQKDQCYTCHADYDFLGPMTAKIKGMRHVMAWYVGYDENIQLYEPFPNANCMQCHGDAALFLESPSHDLMMEEILSGEESCVDCHEVIHDIPGRERDEEDDEEDDVEDDGEGEGESDGD
jgi:cytochrome c nitrite reductase small subunit